MAMHLFVYISRSSRRTQCCRCGVRLFSSSSSSSSSSSTSGDVEILPFRLTRTQAISRFRHMVSKNWLAPADVKSGASITACRKVYLPFYAFDMRVVTSYAVKIGERHLQLDRQLKPHSVMVWSLYRGVDRDIVYTHDDKETQVYGSYTYKRDLVNIVRAPVSEHASLDVAQQSDDVDEFDVYSLYAQTALEHATSQVMQAEEARVLRLTRELFPSGDQFELVSVKCTYEYTFTKVYMPAFAIEFTRFDGKYPFRCWVGGHTGEVSPQFHYSGTKSGVAAFAASTAASLWLSMAKLMPAGVLFLSPEWFLLSLTASATVGLGAKYYSLFLQHWLERKRLTEQADETKRRDDAEFHAQAQRHDDMYRRYTRQYKREQRYQQWFKSWWQNSSDSSSSSRGRGNNDSLGYYRLLGVRTDADLQTIQQRFRTLAMQHHPDRELDPTKKRGANDRFRDILSAYQVLRDPKKRAQYDLT